MEIDATRSAPRKPRRFRFSLRTLLAFVLLCGAAMTLAKNWPAAWFPYYRVDRANAPVPADFEFSLDDSFFYGQGSIYDSNSGQRLYRLPTTTPTWRGVRFSPLGTYICVYDHKPHGGEWLASVHRTATGAALPLALPFEDAYPQIVFSPNERFAAINEVVSAGKGICATTLIRLPDGAVVRRWNSDGYDALFSPDSEWLSWSDKDVLHVEPVAGGSGWSKEVKSFRAWGSMGKQCQYSPDSSLIALAVSKDSIAVMDAHTGQFEQTIYSADSRCRFSPDSQRIMTMLNHDTTMIRDIKSGKSVATINTAARLDFSPDGKRMYSTAPLAAFDTDTGTRIYARNWGVHHRRNDTAWSESGSIVDLRTGLTTFVTHSKLVAVANVCGDIITEDPNGYAYWRHRDWRTFVRMPETWMVAVFAFLFLASIRSDRRVLARK